MPALKLSVLDQSVARVGHPQDESIRHTLALAEHCEALGYARFWVSEHHAIGAIVGSAPEVLMAAIAARFQFTAVSREGRGWWLLRGSPVDPVVALRAKG
jgi:hypothetical protein